MGKRYIFTVFFFVLITKCKGEIQSFTNYGNGWISSGYHASFGSNSDPQTQIDFSHFNSPSNPFSSLEQSGYSSNSYSSSYIQSSRFPSEDIDDPIFNSDLSESRSNVHISSSSWPWSQDLSFTPFDSSEKTYERNSESVAERFKDYISSSADLLGFGNNDMKISRIYNYTKISDPIEKSKFHAFDTDLPLTNSAHTQMTSKLKYSTSSEIFSKSRDTSYKMSSWVSTPPPSQHIQPKLHTTRNPQNVEKVRYRTSHSQERTTKQPAFKKVSLENSPVGDKNILKYSADLGSHLNSNESSQIAKTNHTLSKLQPALKKYNSSLLPLQEIYYHTEASTQSSRHSETFVMSPKNKTGSLSSDSLISSKYEHPKPRLQVQNHSQSSRNANENVNMKPPYSSTLSSNQLTSSNQSVPLNDTKTQRQTTYGKLTADLHTSSDYAYVKEYKASGSRYTDLLVGLTYYNMARSRRHYNKHFYNDQFYKTRHSLANNNSMVNNSGIEIATCILNIQENDDTILLKIPCDIVSTFTDASKKIQATNITKSTICSTNTIIRNYEVSDLKQKSVIHSTEVPKVTKTQILTNISTTIRTNNTTENLTHNNSTSFTTSSPRHETSGKKTKAIIANTTPISILEITTIPNLQLVEKTKNSTAKSKRSVLSSKLGVNYVQDVKITSSQYKGLELLTVITCTTEVINPLNIKGASLNNTSNIQCNVEIHKQHFFLRNSVNCRTLLRYAKLNKSQRK